MTEPTACLVALATAWGPRHGGINAFNVEWVRSLGIAARRAYRLVCVVPAADAADLADAERHHVTLVSLGIEAPELPASQADDVLARLRATKGLDVDRDTVVWMGHDDKTGPLALALRAALPGSRAVLVNHMAFGAYQDVKKGGAGAAAKQAVQKALFEQADQCLAVGPMLADHLRDSLPTATRAAVTMLVPGLAELDKTVVPVSDQPPANFVAFLGGRLGSDDERIKQALLGVRGYGRAIGEAKTSANTHHALGRSPSLRMRGVPVEQHDEVRQALDREAGRMVECDLRPYTEDRLSYFSDLARSSVALMPSWHEGFGLVAWEAIACQVPVVIGKESGVYRLLYDDEQGAGLGRSVRYVPVEGVRAKAGEPPHTDSDVDAVAKAVLDLGDQLEKAKADAATLVQRLRCSYSWKDCADTTLKALAKHLGLPPLQPAPPIDEPPSGDDGGSKPLQPRPPIPAGDGGGAKTLSPPDEVPTFLRPSVPQSVALARQLGPSALLTARDQVVSFHTARDGFVDGLLTVAGAPGLPRLTLQGVHGPGGVGKTRSALELLRRAEAGGWTGLWLPAEPPADALEVWRALLARHTRPLLLVVDYAEGRQPELLRWLRTALDDARARPDAPRVHLLCLSRAKDWWQALPRQPGCDDALAGMLAGRPAHQGLAEVPDWPAALADRAEAFDAALRDYAAALGEAPPDYPWRPDFNAADYARPLYLHLAALAALAGERPSHGTALLAAQLRREWQHWRRNAPAALAGADAWDDWADALALLALVQGLDAAALSAALKLLGVAQPEALAAALARAYPRDGGGAGALTPDLLAEHLIVERLGAERAPQWLAQAFHPGDEARLTRALEVLARLWPRAWPDATADAPLDRGAQRMVDAVAAAWPGNGDRLVAAVHWHGLALCTPVTASWRALTRTVQIAIAPALALPDYSTPLLSLTVEIKRRVLEAASDEPSRAAALNDLSVSLQYLGDAASLAEALGTAREAVQTYRTLAETSTAAFLPKMALALNTLANNLSDQADPVSRAEALRIVREAVQIYRALAEAEPAAHLPDLAMSLNTLAYCLSEQGGTVSRAEALSTTREAVQSYRRLADAQPAAYLPYLAASLNNLAIDLGEQGDATSRAEALPVAREAMQTYRRLARFQPAAYLPDLAMSLHNLAISLFKQSDAALRTEARRTAREAVSIFSTLFEQMPAAFEKNLGIAKRTLARLERQSDE